jgi:hypothetical protein
MQGTTSSPAIHGRFTGKIKDGKGASFSVLAIPPVLPPVARSKDNVQKSLKRNADYPCGYYPQFSKSKNSVSA